MVKDTQYYDILGISPNATQSEIKKSYHTKAIKSHPDKGGSEDEFKKIAEAYGTLSDTDKRRHYDQFGKEGVPQFNPHDLFSSLFGDIFGNSHQQQTRVAKSDTVVCTRTMSLEKLYEKNVLKLKLERRRICACASSSTVCDNCNGSGKTVEIRKINPLMVQHIQVSCSKCNSTGKSFIPCGECTKGSIIDHKTFEICLDPFPKDGERYSFPGEGNHDMGTEPGDFIVVIQYLPHPEFTVINNRDIYTKRTVTLKEALTGFKVIIKHPSGEDIPIDTTGKVLKPNVPIVVPRKGIADGNLAIKLDFIFPSSFTNEDIETLKMILP